MTSTRAVLQRDLRRPSLEALLLGLILLTAAACLFAATRWLRINYDEYANVHATWLVAQGGRPYTDFQAMHTPFFWYLFAPVLSFLPQAFASILTLRAVNAAASLALILAIALLLTQAFTERESRLWSLAALAIMVFQVPAVATLAQFRADHLSAALLFFGMILLEDDAPSARRAAAAGVLLAVSLALGQKLILLEALFIAALAARQWTLRRRGLPRLAAAVGAGAAAALAAMIVFCLAAGIDLALMPRAVFALQYRLLSGYPRFGLLFFLWDQILQAPLKLLPPLAFGLWGLWRSRDGFFDRRWIALVFGAFALTQAAWVRFPFDQYGDAVYLCWAFPLALFFDQARRVCLRGELLALTLALLAADFVGLNAAARDDCRFGVETHLQIALGDAMLKLAPAGQPVSAQPYCHPLLRRDSTFFWIYGASYSHPDMEEILRSMPEFARDFSYDGYLAQLEARPPSLVATNPMFAGPDYLRAVRGFLAAHAADYAELRSGGLHIFVRRAAAPAAR
ncbi:MAG: hypothetical protein HKL90_14750 [Elusimicrobia bacterium]|nr:hypothetical protein [Elusimicrobiota bacterium]